MAPVEPEGAPAYRTPQDKHRDMLRGWIDGLVVEANATGLTFDQALNLRILVAVDSTSRNLSALVALAGRVSGPASEVLAYYAEQVREVQQGGQPWEK